MNKGIIIRVKGIIIIICKACEYLLINYNKLHLSFTFVNKNVLFINKQIILIQGVLVICPKIGYIFLNLIYSNSGNGRKTNSSGIESLLNVV